MIIIGVIISRAFISSLKKKMVKRTACNKSCSLGEEDLRNILLVNLNAIFEGRAAGEAFSYIGKTDIILNIDRAIS